MRATIAGLGQWLPDRVRDNAEWPPEFIEQSIRRQGDRTLVDIGAADDGEAQRVSSAHLEREARDPFLGTTRRRVADAGASSCDAEAFAALSALRDAAIEPVEVDVILSWALVPERICPSNAARVAHTIGARRAWAMGCEAACATVITQLELAASLIEAGRARTVLITQSHLLTRAMPMMHPASPNVGDAAAAMVVTASEQPGVLATHAVTEGNYYEAVLWRRNDDAADEAPWWLPGGSLHIGSHDSPGARWLMQNTVRIAADTVGELMDKAREPVERIDALACVQPRGWVPQAIAQVLGVPRERAPQTFDEYAHLGGVGVLVNLLAARDAGLLTEGANVVLYAQGAGFTRAAALLRWGASRT